MVSGSIGLRDLLSLFQAVLWCHMDCVLIHNSHRAWSIPLLQWSNLWYEHKVYSNMYPYLKLICPLLQPSSIWAKAWLLTLLTSHYLQLGKILNTLAYSALITSHHLEGCEKSQQRLALELTGGSPSPSAWILGPQTKPRILLKSSE